MATVMADGVRGDPKQIPGQKGNDVLPPDNFVRPPKSGSVQSGSAQGGSSLKSVSLKSGSVNNGKGSVNLNDTKRSSFDSQLSAAQLKVIIVRPSFTQDFMFN